VRIIAASAPAPPAAAAKPITSAASAGEVNIERRIVERHGQEVKLTPAEVHRRLLPPESRSGPHPVRDVILNFLLGYNSFPTPVPSTPTSSNSGQKFEADPAVPRHFLTVHGVGNLPP
jgi:hypothetical protein